MTLTARIWIGEDLENSVAFPAPDFDVGPYALSWVTRRLLDDDHTQNREFVFPDIGFDANAARRIRVAEAREKHRTEEEPDTEDVMTLRAHWRYNKGVGLELIAGLFLSVLDSPQRVHCAMRVDTTGERPVPVEAARDGKPDGRAYFGDFIILNEVTTIRNLNKGDIEEQWESAQAHVAEAATDRPRIYCFMVSRLGLDGYDGKSPRRRNWQPAKLADAQENQEALKTEAAVKFLVFNFEDVAEIALKLHELYCMQDHRGPRPRALTEEALGRILDRLHAMTMERVAAGKDFAIGWAGDSFAEMLDNHAKGHPIEGKPPRKPKKA